MSLFIFFVLSSFVMPAYAQEVECIGASLADYSSYVLGQFGGADHHDNIKFLTPVFNMTNANFPTFASSYWNNLRTNGYDYSSFAAVAGNAYNMSSGRIMDHVAVARNTPIGGSPIILTEIGWYPHETNKDINLLRDQIRLFSSNNVIGGLIFNVFGDNPQFIAQSMTDSEISTVCDADCTSANVGANSAVYYFNASGYDQGGNEIGFYVDAARNNMKYTLEIANAGDVLGSVLDGVNSAHAKNMIPIIRLGVGSDGGGFDQPDALVNFITTLANATNGEIYIVLGSNEPLTECWATTGCICGTPSASDEDTITFAGSIITSHAVDVGRKAPGLASYVKTNEPILGATVCAYTGYREWPTGKLGDNIPGLVAETTTDGEGRFEINIDITDPANIGDADNYPGNYYVAFSCGGLLKDFWVMNSAQDLYNWDITLDCPVDPTPIGCPDSLNYQDNKNRWSCFANPGSALEQSLTMDDDQNGQGAENVRLINWDLDSTFVGASNETCICGASGCPAIKPGCCDPAIELCMPQVQAEQSGENLEGRYDIRYLNKDVNDIRNAIHTTIGGPLLELTPDTAEERPHDAGPTYIPIDCEEFRKCNREIGDRNDVGEANASTCSGYGLALATPGDWEKRYEAADKTLYVCKLYSMPPADLLGGKGGDITHFPFDIQIRDIKPPWEGDINNYILTEEYFFLSICYWANRQNWRLAV